ncbi:hypothetical protein HK405_002700, partial [Cladochytrium tenue]
MISPQAAPAFHASYRALYDAPGASAIPFNSGPGAAANGETPKFLALPTKRNFQPSSRAAAAGSRLAASGAVALGAVWKALGRAARRAGAAVTQQLAVREDGGAGGGVVAGSEEIGSGGEGREGPQAADRMRATSPGPEAAHLDFERALLPFIFEAMGVSAGQKSCGATPHSTGSDGLERIGRARLIKSGSTGSVLGEMPAVSPATEIPIPDAARLGDIGDQVDAYCWPESDNAEEERQRIMRVVSVFLPSPTEWMVLDELRV